jgi:superfamily II DNA or RNA helicase
MTAMRFLRSKRLRALLWYAADGRCALCGRPLPPGWHADHVVPYKESGITNIHGMQALCPGCNLKKGSSTMFDLKKQPERSLRAHQEAVREICKEIIAGRPIDRIEVFVTPGGGKSAIPVIAAAELIPTGFADKICWIVPRLSLQTQAEQQFLNPWLRKYLGHDLSVRSSTNEYDPSRGACGFVTTYQALGQDQGQTVLQEFRRHRYILIPDEIHHSAVGSEWERALLPLLDTCKLAILMTGSRHRGDGRKITRFRYREVPGGEMLDLAQDERTAVVQYTLTDALRERAVIQIHAVFQDCRAEWIDRDGERRTVQSFDDATDSTDAVFTALRTNYAYEMIDQAIRHWNAHRIINPRAKILFVAPDIKTAKMYKEYIDAAGVHALIATSEDSKSALQAIHRFKQVGTPSAVNALVTVAMAYEGLDVPSITHLVALTHIRSAPWIEQMIARATRHDPHAGRWEDQKAYLFLPDDYEMRAIIHLMMAQQELMVPSAPEPGGENPGDPPPEKVEPGPGAGGEIIPMASGMTKGRMMDLSTGERIPPEEYARLTEEMDRQSIFGVSPLQMKRFLNSYLARDPDDDPRPGPPPRDPADDQPMMTDTQREIKVKADIQAFCNRVDFRTQAAPGDTNRRVMAQFKKSRDLMGLDELLQVWAWLQRNFADREAS